MRELSLFSGAGGGLLGTKLLGWEHLGYVEFNEYCQKVIRQRIEDGILDRAPIFSDIRAFIDEGYADSYQGMVDVVTAGFPCQPFSVAGKQAGEDDPRNMWPQTIDVIRRVRPRFAFLENVPGLLHNEYIRRIFGDLAELGMDVSWCVLGADDLGFCHHRKRLWMVCKHTSSGFGEVERQIRRGRGFWKQVPRYTYSPRESEPGMVAVADGMAKPIHELKSLGNGQVPAVVRAAWHLLN
jgi:DNA (cytosine-5)-methyltransferase 1